MRKVVSSRREDSDLKMKKQSSEWDTIERIRKVRNKSGPLELRDHNEDHWAKTGMIKSMSITFFSIRQNLWADFDWLFLTCFFHFW